MEIRFFQKFKGSIISNGLAFLSDFCANYSAWTTRESEFPFIRIENRKDNHLFQEKGGEIWNPGWFRDQKLNWSAFNELIRRPDVLRTYRAFF